MRTCEEATTLYMAIRKKFGPRKKRKLACFEGQKFFRFGNSWRRLSFDKTKTIVLNDDEEKLLIL